jgi:biopolymer transport protein ExbD
MSIIKKNKRRECEDVDVDMVPIMNMFLVLIPFLLMSASFLHIKAINTSVPVISNTADIDEQKKHEKKLTIIVELGEKSLELYAISDTVDTVELKKIENRIEKKSQDQALKQLALLLGKIKQDYPASDTVIIIPGENVVYETIIETMDVARYNKDLPLFPKVVLSAKLS